MNVKVVIGANFGDEGKGSVTNYFCSNFTSNGIVVCSNGGSQRGHTVHHNGIKHTFRHFGSGSFHGCYTYLPEKYIVNPMTFVKEYNELSSIGVIPKVFVNKKCLVTTPYDMILNQLVENSRGDRRHGSVGVGIWETIVRNDNNCVTFGDLCDDNFLRNYIFWVRDSFFRKRLKEYGLSCPSDLSSVIFSDGFIEHYIFDFKFMKTVVTSVEDDMFLKSFDNICFENGQGLLLDQDLNKNGIHCTPSNTGIKNAKEIIDKLECNNVEVCYVTRTYLTRHGVGDFNDKSFSFVDDANQYNKYQGSLRFDYLNVGELKRRIFNDIDNNNFKISLAVTHMDEISIDLNNFNEFDNVYFSSSKERLVEYK